MPSTQSWLGFIGVIATAIALLYQPVYLRLIVFGVFRPQDSFPNARVLDTFRNIPNTGLCEDLHHHRPSNLLFAACQDDEAQRFDWFPPLGNFKDHTNLNQGSLALIDPVTFDVKKLKLKRFTGPFVTHGIDIISSLDDPQLVYIFAVNHLPNPLHYHTPSEESRSPDKGRSQIELFKHKIGSDDAEHIRTVRHPLIRTPNDIAATSPDAFYVTNDHYYREGHLRAVEDVMPQRVAPWSDTVHVKISDLKSKDPEAGIAVTTALTGLHNNNGLNHGHPDRPSEVLICDASGGVLHRARRPLDPAAEPKLTWLDSFQLESCLDNPSYYVDNYATAANNASGYLLPGLARGLELADNWDKADKPVPVVVWHLRADSTPTNRTMAGWTPHLIFQDAGRTVRSASGAALVGIDPKTNAGKKQAWLFVTGFVSRAIGAVKIDL